MINKKEQTPAHMYKIKIKNKTKQHHHHTLTKPKNNYAGQDSGQMHMCIHMYMCTDVYMTAFHLKCIQVGMP